MTEAIIIMLNMRGGCATVGEKVHALFRVNGRRPPTKRIGDDANGDSRVAAETSVTTV